MAACKKYTWPFVFHMQPATLSSRHVASWPHSYSNRYGRHAANCSIFCSISTHLTIELAKRVDVLSVSWPINPLWSTRIRYENRKITVLFIKNCRPYLAASFLIFKCTINIARYQKVCTRSFALIFFCSTWTKS
jgi:hypothetical protein